MSLATLVKLRKTELDAQRSRLAQALEHLDQIEISLTRLEHKKAAEREIPRDEASHATYGAFLQKTIQEERALAHDRVAAVQAVRTAQDRLLELFEEQKRYEIAETQRIEAEKRETNRRETIDLDEIGSIAHQRKQRE